MKYEILVGSKSFQIDSKEIEVYLGTLFGGSTKLISIEKIGEGFHNAGFLIILTISNQIKRIVMRVVRGDTGWGHDYLSDHSSVLLLQHSLLRSAPVGTCSESFDVAALTSDGTIKSIGDSIEFLHFVDEIPESESSPYSNDLFKIAEKQSLSDKDRLRAGVIAEYLAKLHSQKNQNPNLYARHIRDLIGHGEMLMGVIDTYPPTIDLDFTSIEELEKVEVETVRWRNRIKYSSERCSRIHGDVHPFGNLRFKDDNSILALDMSREKFGEPADDVAGLSINYLFFSIWKHGKLTPHFEKLFRIFLDEYINKTKDKDILRYMPPFYAFRGTVIAHPLYYPDLETFKRRKIFNFILNVINDKEFNSDSLESYIEKEPN
ncbi:hypothetical protein E2P64_01620 [Candidatus Bathyarchaeota archaeon]|nr:hypothetical protein E2P64_01620 [Candidatus Bathyarchaeota archaeon]